MANNEGKEEKYTDILWDTIAEKIGGYLSDSDMSFQDCADRINEYCVENEIDYSSTPQGIHQYLRTGKRETKITPAFISVFAQTFNVSADWLMGLADTQSIDADNKSVSKVLGLTDSETIEALKQALTRKRKDDDICKPLLEKVIQSDEFGRLFDGYYLWLHSNYHYNSFINSDIDGKKTNKDVLKDAAEEMYGNNFDQAYASVMRNAWQAVEKIDVREFYMQREQLGKQNADKTVISKITKGRQKK